MKRVLSMFLVLVMAAPIAAIAETAVAPAESQQSQKKQVSGVVTDKSGIPVIGAAIAVPGTSTGTVTDANGRYSLAVPNGTKVLEVSCIGYTTQTSLLDPPANMMLFFQRIPSCLPRQLLSVTAQ